MRWLWAGVTLVLAMGGCGQNDPGGDGAAPVVPAESVSASSSPAAVHAGPPWHSVAGDGPEFSGATRVTTGPRASMNGFDNETLFQRVWSYDGRVVSASVDIDRADPDADRRDAMERVETVSGIAGHLVVPLPGIGDGGLAVLDQNQKGDDHPLVRTHASSGNASVSVLMYVDGVLNDKADVTAHSTELIAALNDVLDSLRP